MIFKKPIFYHDMENITGLRTVEWKNNKVIMIEQTKLPTELVFVEYDDFIE